jgi:hypothetical protein
MQPNEFRTSWGFDGSVDIKAGDQWLFIPSELVPYLIKELQQGYASFEAGRIHVENQS